MTIVTRADKGTPLTHTEMDANFIELDTIPSGKVFPSGNALGVKIGTTTPEFGWRTVPGVGFVDPTAPIGPTIETYIGNIAEFNFAENAAMIARVQMPHDYVEGTDIYAIVNWSHNSDKVTGGSVTFGFEISLAKSFEGNPFTSPILHSLAQNASTGQRILMHSESAVSTPGGSVTQLDTDEIESDAILITRFYLDSNDLITSDASTPNPFVHTVNLAYQSRVLPKRNRIPPFWDE